jgi:hypothetical protein
MNAVPVALSEIRKHGGWFVSQYVRRSSHMMMPKLYWMCGLWPMPPLISVVLNVCDDAEEAFDVRPHTCIPNNI